MSVDPPHEDLYDKMLADVNKTLQENQRFLAALKQDRFADDGELDDEDATEDDGFEEL